MDKVSDSPNPDPILSLAEMWDNIPKKRQDEIIEQLIEEQENE